LVPVVGDTTPVEFQVVVRDDSENLTGVLGTIQKVLHSIARVFGLAEAENYTQTVNFNVDPILQLPPSLLAVGGLPYVLGGDPVKLLSVAEIVDLDSSSLKSATVTIGLGRQDGHAGLRCAAGQHHSGDVGQRLDSATDRVGIAGAV
ncbi:MAG: hypothetical protein WA944_22590, partial [Mycobacterium sp.]